MADRRPTAVAALTGAELRRRLAFELADAGIELLAMADNAADARSMLTAHRPDLFIADAQLPVLDGEHLCLELLSGFRLSVHPGAMLLYYPEFPLTHRNELLRLGVVLVKKPLDGAEFSSALQEICTAHPRFDEDSRQRADALLDALGVPAHTGRECLKRAALICAADEGCMHPRRRRLYPLLEKELGLPAGQAERAMRHAIDLAWQSDKLNNQHRIFAGAVDAGRGQPTLGEMISRLADILRLEGRES